MHVHCPGLCEIVEPDETLEGHRAQLAVEQEASGLASASTLKTSSSSATSSPHASRRGSEDAEMVVPANAAGYVGVPEPLPVHDWDIDGAPTQQLDGQDNSPVAFFEDGISSEGDVDWYFDAVEDMGHWDAYVDDVDSDDGDNVDDGHDVGGHGEGDQVQVVESDHGNSPSESEDGEEAEGEEEGEGGQGDGSIPAQGFRLPHPDQAPPNQRVAAYLERMDELVGTGPSETLRHYVFRHMPHLTLGAPKSTREIKAFLQGEKAAHQPGNLIPPTLHIVSALLITDGPHIDVDLTMMLSKGLALGPVFTVQMKRLIGVKPTSMRDIHVCPCGDYVYDPLADPKPDFLESLYELHHQAAADMANGGVYQEVYQQHTCPLCKCSRLCKMPVPGTERHTYDPHSVSACLNRKLACCRCIQLCLQQPISWRGSMPWRCSCLCVAPCAQRVYYLGLQEALLDPNFRDPEFCAALGAERSTDDPYSWWGADEHRRLSRLIPYDQREDQRPPCILNVSVAGDFGQPFNTNRHSTGVIGVRCVCFS